jgi:hypothetical protein
VKLVVAVREPVDCDPDVAWDPDQSPDAAQDWALLECQVRVAAWPEVMVLGLTCKETMGAAGAIVTVVDWVALPNSPTQVNSNSVEVDRAPVDALPLVGFAPLQPPEAVQEVAFAAFQVKIDAAPTATVVADADNVMVGPGPVTTTSADCVVEPPGPEQVSV